MVKGFSPSIWARTIRTFRVLRLQHPTDRAGGRRSRGVERRGPPLTAALPRAIPSARRRGRGGAGRKSPSCGTPQELSARRGTALRRISPDRLVGMGEEPVLGDGACGAVPASAVRPSGACRDIQGRRRRGCSTRPSGSVEPLAPRGAPRGLAPPIPGGAGNWVLDEGEYAPSGSVEPLTGSREAVANRRGESERFAGTGGGRGASRASEVAMRRGKAGTAAEER